jgi:predicted nucleotidyltransferase
LLWLAGAGGYGRCVPSYDALPALARPLLDRLLAAAARDERIVGVTAGGSAVTGTMDEFSDLDLVVVCRDGDDGAVLGDVRALAAAVGPLLAAFRGDHVGEPRLLIALYGPPLLHVDFKVVALRDLAHRVEDAHVLWERDGAVQEATATTTAIWPAPDGQWIEDRFWVWVHYGSTKIGRGELFECLDLLALLRSAALGPLIARDHSQRPQGVRRLERYAPELVDALAATVGDHSRPGCTAALRTAADLYRALRARAADPGLKPRADAEREALAFLDALD